METYVAQSRQGRRRGLVFTKLGNFIAKMAIAAALCSGLAACHKEGPAEKAGKQLDQAATDVGNKVEDVCEKAKEEAGAKDTRC